MMNTQTIPHGAAEIVALRKAGKRPADLVLVSLVGPLRGEGNPQVIAKASRHYDWRFLVGLEVMLVANDSLPKQAVREVMADLRALHLEYLGLWLADHQQGINVVVGGINARPRGLLRHMGTYEMQSFSGLGLAQKGGVQCA